MGLQCFFEVSNMWVEGIKNFSLLKSRQVLGQSVLTPFILVRCIQLFNITNLENIININEFLMLIHESYNNLERRIPFTNTKNNMH
jgi:hypothetical protein